MGFASVGSGAEALQLCVFDLRRGQNEGQELEKILFFFPVDVPFPTQLSVIGLSEGLITFTRLFSSEAACEVIEAEKNLSVFYEAEPDIWMVLVAEKDKESGAIWNFNALRKVLKEVHSLFVMFSGSLRSSLEREPSATSVRSNLYTFILDYLSDFFAGKKIQLPSFRDCLKERGTIKMLSVGREVAIEVQSLVKMLESCAGNTQCHSLILFQDLLVSTTLPPDDSLNLYAYAVMRLTPHALTSAASTWSSLLKGNSYSQSGTTLVQPMSNSGQSQDSWDPNPSYSTYRAMRPLQHGKWSKGKDGFLVTDIWGSEAGTTVFATPTVSLHHTEEKMYMCTYQYKSLNFILLVPVSAMINGAQDVSVLKQQLVENASPRILRTEEKLSKEWGGENAYHVSGYRYLLLDNDIDVSRASPPGKVTTLSKDSLLAMSKLREEVDAEKRRAKHSTGSQEKDMEICIRAKNNAWVIARLTKGKELYMALERASETLLYASDAIEKFSDRYCNGVFSLD